MVAAVSVVGAPVARATTNTYSLNGVAAISAASAWAVGYFIHGSGHSRTLIEHWNGAAWRVKASPNVGTGNNTLNGVVAISRSNAWAVGSYTGASGHRRTLVEHWNGAGWKVKASPNVGTGNNSLNGVDATSGTNAWAVGSRSGGRRTLIERWNGSAWRVKASPNVGTSANRLTGVAVTGAGNAWAV